MSFTLHLVFSHAGLAAARPLVATTDRLVCMQDLGNPVTPAGTTARITADPGGADPAAEAITVIDYATLAEWCTAAARVASWP